MSKYREVRDDFKTGDVVLFSGKNILSSLIKFGTKSKWSHVGVLIRISEYDKILLAESIEGTGVRLTRLSEVLEKTKSNVSVYRHKNHHHIKSNEKYFINKAFDNLGQPYDLKNIVTIAFKIVLSWLKINTLNPIGENKAFICSEYVDNLYSSIGLQVSWDKRGFIAPADFAKDCNFEELHKLK